MALSTTLTTAASGLRATSVRASSAANNIVNINTPGFEASTLSQQTVYSGSNPGGGTAVEAQLIGSGLAPDLGQELTTLIEAETVYRANAEVFRTASELSRRTLDALA
ncbi:flagellar basal body protein [Thalassospiraceae bacterium LMO-JJ14]|nr:flagellar basal body protein [Thalassospiraceae bacterium LMO-JJ14]